MDQNREAILRLAQDALNERGGGGYEVHFVFSCPRCAARCVLAEANTLFEEGECHGCGAVTPIEVADFVLVLCGEIQPHDGPHDEPSSLSAEVTTESGTVAADEQLLDRLLRLLSVQHVGLGMDDLFGLLLCPRCAGDLSDDGRCRACGWSDHDGEDVLDQH